MWGYFKYWNIIHFLHKARFSEYINKIHWVVLDGIIDNMAALVQIGKYDAINTIDETTMC